MSRTTCEELAVVRIRETPNSTLQRGGESLPGCPIAGALSNDLKTGSQSEPLLATCTNKHTDIQSAHAISR